MRLFAKQIVAHVLVAAACVMMPACASTVRPESVVERFYSTTLRHHVTGLPSGKDLDRLAPLLSERLYGKILAALAYQSESVTRHPDERSAAGRPPVVYKPPFVDGDFFSGDFEGPKAFKVLSSSKRAEGGWEVLVRFTAEPAAEAWYDKVVVVQEHERAVIDDVLYSDHGPFNALGSLSDRLAWRGERERPSTPNSALQRTSAACCYATFTFCVAEAGEPQSR
jgi:hypothetical protein